MESNLNIPAVINYIVNWLKKYAESNNIRGFVVGVSGGVDSAVVSKLCAMTGLHTVCVTMSIKQNDDELGRAERHLRRLHQQSAEQGVFNIDPLYYDLTGVYEHQILVMNHTKFANHIRPTDHESDLVAMANVRSRLRMTTLYYLATKHKLLVVGASNKTEDFGVGFFTKYGDGGVDINPIADLHKSEVYALAVALGISEDIRNARPTDGLWDDGRTDEDQLGATYDELEFVIDFLDNTFPKGMKYQDIDMSMFDNLTERQREVLAIYIKRNVDNKHKMIPVPVCEIRNNVDLIKMSPEERELFKKLDLLNARKHQMVLSRNYEDAVILAKEEDEIRKSIAATGRFNYSDLK